jgi:hypothetical protein
MSQGIVLAVDVQADAARVFEILSTTEGQRGFWTANCDVSAELDGSVSSLRRPTSTSPSLPRRASSCG